MEEALAKIKSIKNDLKKAEKHYQDTNQIILTYGMIGVRISEIEKIMESYKNESI